MCLKGQEDSSIGGFRELHEKKNVKSQYVSTQSTKLKILRSSLKPTNYSNVLYMCPADI